MSSAQNRVLVWLKRNLWLLLVFQWILDILEAGCLITGLKATALFIVLSERSTISRVSAIRILTQHVLEPTRAVMVLDIVLSSQK